MEWKSYYDSKTVSAEEAAAKIQSEQQIVLTHAAGEGSLLLKALAKRQKEIRDVVVWHGVSFGPGYHVAEDIDPASIRYEGIFIGAATRKAVREGRGELTPGHFSDAPQNIRNGIIPCNIAAMHMSPPDSYGYCSLGLSTDYEVAAIEKADIVIAEINRNMPHTRGNSLVHVTEIDYFIQSDEPLVVIGKSVIGPEEEAIGKYIADLIEDGSCLQIGIGAMPDAVMSFLTHKNDLGLHTEMMTTGAMDLIKAGVITGRCKNINKGKAVATFAGGTRELYDWLNDNPGVEFYPVDYVNNSHVISQNDKAVSINAALQVDLLGQVNAETIGTSQYSGVGGQMDFVRGATWSKGGKSFIALNATAKDGTISRISAALPAGVPITTSRNDVDYIVTEFGVAALRGQTVTERARRLIAIAHPDFRDSLKADFERIYCLKL